jgi:GNAT superfamily N-acetyltransferase
MEFRRAAELDLRAQYELFVAAEVELWHRHGLPWSAAPFQAWSQLHRHLLAEDGERSFVALDGERLVGFSAALVRGATWFLAALFVSPEYQGRGVGRDLLDRSWAGDYRSRMTITASIQPVSTGMYARRGLIPTTPILTLSGAPRCALPDGLQAIPPEPEALATLDRSAYGFDRAADHRFWAERAAHANLWLLAGEPMAYAYVDSQGLIGPSPAVTVQRPHWPCERNSPVGNRDLQRFCCRLPRPAWSRPRWRAAFGSPVRLAYSWSAAAPIHLRPWRSQAIGCSEAAKRGTGRQLRHPASTNDDHLRRTSASRSHHAARTPAPGLRRACGAPGSSEGDPEGDQGRAGSRAWPRRAAARGGPYRPAAGPAGLGAVGAGAAQRLAVDRHRPSPSVGTVAVGQPAPIAAATQRARTGWGASVAHSAIAAIDWAPAKPAAAAGTRMAASGCRRPGAGPGVGDGGQVGAQVWCLGRSQRISVAQCGQAGWDRG